MKIGKNAKGRNGLKKKNEEAGTFSIVIESLRSHRAAQFSTIHRDVSDAGSRSQGAREAPDPCTNFLVAR
jgi:hypothetical protein